MGSRAAPPSAPRGPVVSAPLSTSTPTPPTASTAVPPSATSAPTALQLKYLGFFRAAALEIYFFLIQIYEHLKEKSGSLKPGIERVEGTVKTAVGPVVSRVKFDPDEYLKFVDTKVDETLKFAEERTPAEWKAKALAVYDYASKVPEKTQAAVDEYNQKGAAATAQSYFEYFLPIAVAYLQAVWGFVLALPLVPQIVYAAQPYVVYIAQQYNAVLTEAKKSDLPLARTLTQVLPMIPVEKLKKSE